MAGLLDMLFGPQGLLGLNGPQQPGMGFPQLDSDNNPIPGLSSPFGNPMQQFTGMPQQAQPMVQGNGPSPLDGAQWPAGPMGAPGAAMAQAPQMPQQPMGQPPQSEGPGMLQRLAGTGGIIGGLANTIGAVTGGNDVDPAKHPGPAGQVYRMMIQKGMDPATAKLLAGKKETALAWVAQQTKPPELTNDLKNLAAENASRAQRGLPPLSPMEFITATKKAGAINIKNEGNIPPGYEVERDAEGRAVRLKPIPGSPAAQTAATSASKAIDGAQQAISLIDNTLAMPGFDGLYGVPGKVPVLPGSDRANAQAALNQIGGQAFLDAFETLKGGGQITQIEGEKATAARTRMLDRNQSPQAAREAAKEFVGIIRQGMERARKASGQSAADGDYGEWRDVAPGVRVRERR